MSRFLPFLVVATVLGAQESAAGMEQNHVLLGFSSAQGEAAKNLDLGWIAGIGGTYWFSSNWGLHLEGQVNRYTLSESLLREMGPASGGRGELFAVLFHAAWHPAGTPGHGFYVLAGGGGAYRRIEVTQTLPTALPQGQSWVGVAPGEVPPKEVTTSRPAFSVALGWEAPMRGGSTFFVEARYLRVFTRGAAMDVVPLVAGIRF